MVKKSGIRLGGVALVLLAALGAQTALAEDAYFGNFEEDVMYDGQYILDQTAEGYAGWRDWDYAPEGETRPPQNGDPSTEYGVTTGNYSIGFHPYGGYDQGLTVKLQDLPSGTREAAFDGLLTHTSLAMNVTWNNDDSADVNPTWYEQYNGDGWNGCSVQLFINYGPGGTYDTIGYPTEDTGNPGDYKGYWDLTNYPGVHTRVMTWDYSAYLPDLQALADSGDLSATGGWVEFMLITTIGNFNLPVTFYFDSWRFTGDIIPEGTVGDYNDDGIVDAADYTVWRDNLGGDGSALANRDPSITGAIGEDDYTAWKDHFGQTTGGGGALGVSAVPEPATFVLALLALGFLPLVARRSR